MDININGNPGSGNTFIDIKIDHADTVAPNATTISNTYNITNNGPVKGSGSMSSTQADEELKKVYKKKILDYVGRLKQYVSPVWEKDYDTLWLSILKLPAVDAEVYNKGHQHHTDFNRNLVAGIIKMMNGNVLVETEASTLAVALENSQKHPVRGALGKWPSQEIQNAVKPLLTKEKKNE